MSVATLVVVLVVAVLAIAVAIQQREIALLKRSIADHIRLDIEESSVLDQDPDHWPHGVLEVGTHLPRDMPLETGRWTVVVLLRAECSKCQQILSELPSTASTLPANYSITLASASADWLGARGLPVVTLPGTDGVPAPSLLLLDDEGVIQGRGPADSGRSILDFIEDGRRHGFGPGTETMVPSGRAQPIAH